MRWNRLLVAGMLGAFALISVAAAPPPLRGIPQKETADLLQNWGEGDSFMAFFDNGKAEASSTLPPSASASYSARKAFDGNLGTAWVEGAKGDGVGQWIEYSLRPQPGLNAAVTTLSIFNGYRKSRDLWQRNGRIRGLRMSVNGTPWRRIQLADSFAYQIVRLPSLPVPRRGRPLVVRFTIESVYRGTRHRDTALSEIEFGGTGVF